MINLIMKTKVSLKRKKVLLLKAKDKILIDH
jgi:hypothetical protein